MWRDAAFRNLFRRSRGSVWIGIRVQPRVRKPRGGSERSEPRRFAKHIVIRADTRHLTLSAEPLASFNRLPKRRGAALNY